MPYRRWGSFNSRLPSTRSANSNSSCDHHWFSDVILPDGRAGRPVEVRFVPYRDDEAEAEGDGDEQTGQPERPVPRADSLAADVYADIAVARGMEDLDQLFADVRTTLVVAFVLLMGAAVLLVRLSVDRGLKPLNKIASKVRNLDADKLNTRLPDTPGGNELMPITRQINDLLERLSAAFQREKRFSGNVAHELRTPIAELRTMAEVGKEWPADRDMVKDFFNELVYLADDMKRTVTNLMMLSQLDAGTQRVDMVPINRYRLIERTGTVWFSTQTAKRFGSIILFARTCRCAVMRTSWL